jgi:hypothetical protein
MMMIKNTRDYFYIPPVLTLKMRISALVLYLYVLYGSPNSPCLPTYTALTVLYKRHGVCSLCGTKCI